MGSAETEDGRLREQIEGMRVPCRHTPEVVRLSRTEKLSQREIAERLGISKTTVNEILKREKIAVEGARPGS